VARLVQIDPRRPRRGLIEEAAAQLRLGQVIGMPTETFYGLAADALNPVAVAKVYELKRRPTDLPLPVIVDSLAMLERIAELPPVALRLAEKFWPGPLSLILPAKGLVPPNLTGGTGKLAARISSHPVATGLAAALGGPVTATSANLSGRAGLLSAPEVEAELGHGLALVLDGGRATARTGSTLLDVTVSPPEIVRPGLVPEELIRRYLARSRA
jgi:L-threonylcarbamoyladenylate synthase